jgi:hypothetical protein
MDTWSREPRLFAFFLAFLLVCSVITSAGAPGAPARWGLDLAPMNPFDMPGTTAGLPQGWNSLYLNSCMFKDMLPLKGNLEFGYLSQFNENIRTSRFTIDGLLPARAGHEEQPLEKFTANS